MIEGQRKTSHNLYNIYNSKKENQRYYRIHYFWIKKGINIAQQKKQKQKKTVERNVKP